MGRKPKSRYLAGRMAFYKKQIENLEEKNDRLTEIIVTQVEQQNK